MVNQIELNLPLHGNAEAPDPDKAVVLLNGQPIEGVTAVRVSAKFGEDTVVELSLIAKVTGLANFKDISELTLVTD